MHFVFIGSFIYLIKIQIDFKLKRKNKIFFFFHFSGLNFSQNSTKAKVIHLFHSHFDFFWMKFHSMVDLKIKYFIDLLPFLLLFVLIYCLHSINRFFFSFISKSSIIEYPFPIIMYLFIYH